MIILLLRLPLLLALPPMHLKHHLHDYGTPEGDYFNHAGNLIPLRNAQAIKTSGCAVNTSAIVQVASPPRCTDLHRVFVANTTMKCSTQSSS